MVLSRFQIRKVEKFEQRKPHELELYNENDHSADRIAKKKTK